MDPDYIRSPNTRKVRQLEHEAKEELNKRVERVVEKQFGLAQDEKHSEIELIDDRILKVQQMLHTHRYCTSMNYFAVDKISKSSTNDNKNETHPAVRKLQSREENNETQSKVKRSLSSDEKLSSLSTMENSPKRLKLSNDVKASTPKSVNLMTNPMPHLPETSPINYNGRLEKYKEKKRLVIGNTYQYIGTKDACSEGENALKYKWQVYVRSPSNGEGIEKYIAFVNFTLDESYSPHDVITVEKSPFSLSRRGWGEFKVKIKIHFKNERNRPLELLHPLTLVRKDDQLALTGLWRLGVEKWYDVWVYEETSNPMCDSNQNLTEPKRRDLSKELETGKITTNCEGNVTITHDTYIKKKPLDPCEEANKNVISPQILNSISAQRSSVLMVQHAAQVVKDKMKETSNGCIAPKSIEMQTINKLPAPNLPNGVNKTDTKKETRMIRLRQEDGTLINYYIPAKLYPLAEKLAKESTTSKPNGPDMLKQSSNSAVRVEVPGVNKVFTVTLKQGENKVNNTPTKNIVINSQNALPLNHLSKLNSKQIILNKNPTNVFSIKNNLPVSLLKADKRETENTFCSPNKPSINKIPIITNNKQLVGKTLKSGMIISSNELQQSQSIPISLANMNSQKLIRLPITAKNGQVYLQGIHLDKLKAHLVANQNKNANGMKIQSLHKNAPSLQNKQNIIKISNSTNLSGRATTNHIITIPSSKTLPMSMIQSGATNVIPMKKSLVQISSNTQSQVTATTTNANAQQRFILSDKSLLSNVKPIGRQQQLLTNITKGIPQIVIRDRKNHNFVRTLLPSIATSVPITSNIAAGVPPPPNVTVVTNSIASSTPIMTPTNAKKSFVNLPLKVVANNLNTSLLTSLNTVGSALPSGQKIIRIPYSKELLNKISPDKIINIKNEVKNDIEVLCADLKLTMNDLKRISNNLESYHSLFSLWMRSFPLFTASTTRHCEVMNNNCKYQDFISMPIGSQRALEYKRARDIYKTLKGINVGSLNVNETLSVPYLVAWGRRHGYTPVESRPFLRTDELKEINKKSVSSTYSIASLDETSKNIKHESSMNLDTSDIIIDIETIDLTEAKNKKTPIKEEHNNDRKSLLHVPLGSDDSMFDKTQQIEACEWLDQRHSELMLNIEGEEVIPSVKMSASKAMLWQATRRFMEDLLRSSYCTAWGGTSNSAVDVAPSEPVLEGPPKQILESNVRKALLSTRPEFLMFTNSNLGKVPIETELATLKQE